jgi:hypothetical protein
MKDIRKVLLIHPEGNIYNNPTLKCVVDLLLSRGVEVTIRYSQFNPVYGFQSKVSLLEFKNVKPIGYNYLVYKIKNLIFYHLSSPCLAWLSVWLENQFIYEAYDLVIGIDRLGLIEAAYLHQITGTPFVFFSFEIFFESETSSSFKSLERRAAKHVKWWFVQDELRARHLQEENHLDPATCKLIPLASTGFGELSTNRLRDQLGIPKNKHVAILIGSVTAWSMAAEIVASTTGWPDDWVLILHERHGNTRSNLERLGVDLSSIPMDKVYLSSQSKLTVDDMGEILSGVSVGLAFYRPLDGSNSRYPSASKNIEYLGLASGKISTFLRYGIPVIMNEIGLYTDLAKKHDFGLVCQDPSDINKLLTSLYKTSDLSSKAKSFYRSYLDFSNYEDLFSTSLVSAASQI